MNYVLQVVRGRSASNTLKLTDGVTTIGRHDDCVIRIKSSQVSRRHCEVFEVAQKLTIRDLGSSNGTFVNGKRVVGQQVLKLGDELTVGSVSLRVAKLGQTAPAATGGPAFKPKAGDTAVVDAIAVEQEDEEFEMEFDDGDPEPIVEGIPLADEEPAKPVDRKPTPKAGKAATSTNAPTEAVMPAAKPKAGKEDDAIADYLLDLNLDDEE
jgi:predicted component of type VI protein secretion system